MPPPGSDPEEEGESRLARPFRAVTPASRLLFWIRSAFVGDAAIAAFGGILLALGREGPAIGVFVFVAIRAALGVVALLLAERALERRDPNDDRPSAIH